MNYATTVADPESIEWAKLDASVATMIADRDRIEQVISLTAGMANAPHALLVGPPGTGKSSIPANNCLPNQLVEAVQCSDKRSGQALLEMVWVENGSMRVEKGPAARAWAAGSVLVLEEVDRMSGDMADVLHSVLVRGQGARITLLDGTTIRPTDTFRCIATMNGDVEDLPEALIDRFVGQIYRVDCPSTAMIQALPRELRRVCARVYAAVKESRAPLLCTYRQFAAFGQLRGVIGDDMAALGTCRGDAEQADRFLKLVQLAGTPNGSSQNVTN